MLDNLRSYRIILGSGSPRRRELLSGLGLDFSVRLVKDGDESYPESLKGGDIPLYLSRKKAAAYMDTLASDELLITADTIVHLDGKVLGKPHDEAQAKEMLRMLSGRVHEVYTGVSLTTRCFQKSFYVGTKVCFAPLTQDEIDYYVRQFRPMDKAGSYGVQEWIGYMGVERIEGCYYNIMGLPLQRLWRELEQVPAL